MKQRTLNLVPKPVKWLLAGSLLLQIFVYLQLPAKPTLILELPLPPSYEQLRLFTLGDSVVAAKLGILWLQSFDQQQGRVLSYHALDYGILRQWLELLLELDPHSHYPLLLASQVYVSVGTPEKVRKMLDFVYDAYLKYPDQRWPWLLQATVLAKHRIKDLPLSLKYAQALSKGGSNVPIWAQEMQVFILEEMGELEQMRIVIGGMLANGQLTDPNEIKFLNERLKALEQLSP